MRHPLASRAGGHRKVLQISSVEIGHAICGISFPVQAWELSAWADYNGARSLLLDLLALLPVRDYRSCEEIVTALTATPGGRSWLRL